LLLIDWLLALSLSSSLGFLRSLWSSCKEGCCSRPRERARDKERCPRRENSAST
jgi:hypothetical protein